MVPHSRAEQKTHPPLHKKQHCFCIYCTALGLLQQNRHTYFDPASFHPRTIMSARAATLPATCIPDLASLTRMYVHTCRASKNTRRPMLSFIIIQFVSIVYSSSYQILYAQGKILCARGYSRNLYHHPISLRRLPAVPNPMYACKMQIFKPSDFPTDRNLQNGVWLIRYCAKRKRPSYVNEKEIGGGRFMWRSSSQTLT